MKISVLGAGAWGTALAISLAPRHQVCLWARDEQQTSTMQTSRCNQRYLPGISFPPSLLLTSDFDAALADAALLIIAVPVSSLRGVLQRIAKLPVASPVIWLCHFKI